MPYNLGKLFSIQDNYPPARKAFEQAIRLDPAYVEAYDGLGFALEGMGEDAAAVASYEKAIGLNESRNGKFASPYVNLASYFNRTGDWEKALTWARKAVEVNPGSDRGWFQVGRAQERRGEFDAAAESLNRAVGINPRVSSYYYVLASVYRRLGKTQESQQALESFTRLDRESAEIDSKRRDGGRPRIGTMARPDGGGHE
jgi:protein O-GlcNAc transferase